MSNNNTKSWIECQNFSMFSNTAAFTNEMWSDKKFEATTAISFLALYRVHNS